MQASASATMRAYPICFVTGLLLLPQRSAAQQSSYDCDAFFDDVASGWGLTRQSLTNVAGDFSAAFESAINGSSPDETILWTVVFDGSNPSSNPFSALTGETKKHIAFCSPDPYEPAPLIVPDDTRLALANAKWTDPDQAFEDDGTHAFISSTGNGLWLADVTITSTALEPYKSYALWLLSNVEGDHFIERLTVTGATERLTVVQDETINQDQFQGNFDLDAIAWTELGEQASLFQSLCRNSSGDLFECPGIADSSPTTVTVSNSTFSGDDSGADHERSLLLMKGGLNLSNVAVQQIRFDTGIPAIEASGDLVSTMGSTFVELHGTGSRPLLKSRSSKVETSRTLIANVTGWASLLKSRSLDGATIQESYICGVSDTGSLIETHGATTATINMVSTAVVGSHFTDALVLTAATDLEALLANVLLLNIQNPSSGSGEPRLDLIEAGATDSASTIQLSNLLSTHSFFQAGDSPAAAMDAVRVWNPSNTEDCEAWGDTDEDCADLPEPPIFSSEDVLTDLSAPSCGPNLEDLILMMRAEALADTEGSAESQATLQDLRDALLGTLPILSTDQTDLVGAGVSWTASASTCSSNTNGDPDDIGAYGGTCSLSLLAPIAVGSPGDTGATGDTGDGGTNAGDTSGDTDDTTMPSTYANDSGGPSPESSTTASTRFGFLSGCRYSAAALLLPL
ncbi:MAG TPA: hypothetical protein DFR83_00285, partial [Deltaproteobacteria bacterium]|nr:hypothetical protein [Deltaproteobacteria bacterium]